MALDDPCPIWGTPATVESNARIDTSIADSPRAGGKYFIEGTANALLEYRNDELKAKLTTWLIDQRNLGDPCPTITEFTLSDVEKARALSVSERADRLLKYLEVKQGVIGQWVVLEITNQAVKLYGPGHTELGGEMLAHSESLATSEVTYLLSQISAKDLIEITDFNEIPWECTITIYGYDYLDNLRKKTVLSDQAFVAMWFDESMKSAWTDGIEPAVMNAGYKPLRIDGKDHNNKIDDEIVGEIRRSKFLVADFTHGDMGARGGFYYEAGFAHGLNIPVIFTCREDVISNIHFDTRQYNHITWESPMVLREKLSQRISATIGDGPHRV